MHWTPQQQHTLLTVIARRGERDVLRRQLATAQTTLTDKQTQQRQLYEQLDKEQADVDRLQRTSWATFYYKLLNRHAEQLTDEQAEAYRARIAYDDARAMTDTVQAQVATLQDRLKAFDDVEEAYQSMIDAKTAELTIRQDATYRQRVTALTDAEQQLREVKEAQTAGQSALDETIQLEQLLEEARSYGQWDMYGGSEIMSYMKYDKLDRVRDQSQQVSQYLTLFKSELSDVHQTLSAEWNFSDGWTRFADIFFDNIFTDMSVQRRIEQAVANAAQLRHEIEVALDTVAAQYQQRTNEHSQRTDELRTYLEQAD